MLRYAMLGYEDIYMLFYSMLCCAVLCCAVLCNHARRRRSGGRGKRTRTPFRMWGRTVTYCLGSALAHEYVFYVAVMHRTYMDSPLTLDLLECPVCSGGKRPRLKVRQRPLQKLFTFLHLVGCIASLALSSSVVLHGMAK